MSIEPDSAAIFACAHSLCDACHTAAASDPTINLSEAYKGMDQFMRELMRVASHFENWACHHINFNELDEPWPYLLQDRFGDACLQVLPSSELAMFGDHECLRVALRLGLPIKLDQGLPVPVDLTAANPLYTAGAGFPAFRIQTVRNDIEDDNNVEVFTTADDPFDPDYGPPYFGFYGVDANGLSEHIADRATLAEALLLAQKLVPGIEFKIDLRRRE